MPTLPIYSLSVSEVKQTGILVLPGGDGSSLSLYKLNPQVELNRYDLVMVLDDKLPVDVSTGEAFSNAYAYYAAGYAITFQCYLVAKGNAVHPSSTSVQNETS